jgi:hypothetical protein
MAIRYVYSGAAGANNGTSWTNAYTAFGSAVSASTANGDLIYVADDHNEALAGNTTYTFAAHVNVISVNRTSGLASGGAFIGHTTTGRSITLGGTKRIYLYGVTFQVAGASLERIFVAGADESHFEMENCVLSLTSTTSIVSIELGQNNGVGNTYVRLRNSTLKFGHTGQGINARQTVDMEGCIVDPAGSIPATLFQSSGTGGAVRMLNCDLSSITGTLVGVWGNQSSTLHFTNCKLGSGVTVLASQAVANKGSVAAWLYDCAAGDQHYHIAHYDAFGATVVDTGIYADDGAQYDGTNRCAWKITTTANCSYYTPYVSPWFGRYHSATSAITPSIEILRDGSTTAYQDDEVWGEFSYKGTAGSTQASFVNDRMTLLGTPANQAAGVGTSGWTGENASAWSGKLAPASSFTPAEIGHLMARVVVGEPSITVYVDPAIRGA